jgi:hypothetical protein
MMGDVKTLAAKLNREIVEKYDTLQLSDCLNSAMNVTTSKGLIVTDTAAILALADYANQYGSIGPTFTMYLDDNDFDGVTIQEVQEWKLKHTKYGREHPKDCDRRYLNILEVCKKEGV